MLTPALEKIVLSGKGSFNTFVAGGSEKSILNVDNDRFIIITDLTIFPMTPATKLVNWDSATIEAQFVNYQLKVFSEKSYNNFVVKPSMTINGYHDPGSGGDKFTISGGQPVKLDTYLIHESDVSFTVSKALKTTPSSTGVTPAQSVGIRPPFDYGKVGQPGSLPVTLITDTSAAATFFSAMAGNQVVKADGTTTAQELTFPIDATTEISGSIKYPWGVPVILVNYVEIYGNPTNISATL